MPDSLELIVAYAATSDPTCQASLAGLALPHLQRLLARLSPTHQPLAHPDEAGEAPLSLPHERAWAQALGLPDQHGHIPWAAWQAQQRGIKEASEPHSAWALVTPCHWQVGTDHITLIDPARLQLTPPEAQALLEIVAPWLAEDGLQLQLDTPSRWLMQGPLLADLPMPSLERVQGQDVRHWLQHQAQNPHISASQRRAMQVWQRLHSELQMLLYTHPLNEARQARGLPAVNAFWLHGSGCLPAPAPTPTSTQVQYVDTLQASAHHGDWQTWAKAWQALDTEALAQLLEHIQTGGTARLTLCGLRTALTWHTAPRSLGQRLSQFFRPVSFLELAKTL